MTSSDPMAAWQVLGPLMDLVTPMALRVAATLRLADFMPDDGTGDGAVPRRPGRTRRSGPGGAGPHAAPPGLSTGYSPSRVRDSSRPTSPATLLRTGQPRCGVAGSGWFRRPDGPGFYRPGPHRAYRRAAGSRSSASRSGPTWTPTPRSAHPSMRPWPWTPAAPRWRKEYDWTSVRHVADIGGGTGTLIAEVLRRNPQLRGTLADLPETAARARRYLAGLGLDGRCEVVGQISSIRCRPTGCLPAQPRHP